MKRVYIAGPLNANACGYITNIHNMIVEAEKVRKTGFAVFVPGLDFLQGLVFGNWTYTDYFENSQPWLDAADAVFVCPNAENSKGTQREIQRAKQQGIPVFTDLTELIKVLSIMT